MNTGRLMKSRMGYDLPADSPLYAKPPIHFPDAIYMTTVFETDEEAVLDILPEGVEVTAPAVAAVTIASHPTSSLGTYNEAILTVNCVWQGRPYRYVAQIAPNSDAAMAAGREIWGFPKKLAHVELRAEGSLLAGTVERPRGVRLCTMVLHPEQLVPTRREQAGPPTLTLRLIPNPEESSMPSLVELIATDITMSPTQLWRCGASLTFDVHSDIDPWYRFTPKRILAAYHGRFDVVLPYGKVLHRY